MQFQSKLLKRICKELDKLIIKFFLESCMNIKKKYLRTMLGENFVLDMSTLKIIKNFIFTRIYKFSNWTERIVLWYVTNHWGRTLFNTLSVHFAFQKEKIILLLHTRKKPDGLGK